jgi:hypothetical protein
MSTVIPFDLDNQKSILCISQAWAAIIYNHLCLRDGYFLSTPKIYLF